MKPFTLPSLNLLIKTLRALGTVNSNGESKKHGLKFFLLNIYQYLVHLSMILQLLLHFLSTILRSSRNFSEFSQFIMQDVLYFMLYWVLIFYTRRIPQLKELDRLLGGLSRADENVVKKCIKKTKLFIFINSFWTIFFYSASVLEALVPMSAEYNEMRRIVYRVENPQRRLPTNIYLPFVDESRSYYYELFFVFQIYVLVILWSIPICMISTYIPILFIYIEGQYEILAKYAEQIGKRHYDVNKNGIFYTDIEKNEYLLFRDIESVLKSKICYMFDNHIPVFKISSNQNVKNDTTHLIGGDKTSHDVMTRIVIDEEKDTAVLYFKNKPLFEDYDKIYIQQIIKFHQKILFLHNKVCNYFIQYDFEKVATPS